jgi:acyl-CoA synthetase (AMP-forming)/AMP-acid ligase II
MIITGGENVFPTEVENALAGCPGIADVAVIGVPSERWGEEVKAIVVLSAGANVDQARIIEWTKARIASFKVPKSIDFTDALPRNAAGKILKRELRAPYWKGQSRQVS